MRMVGPSPSTAAAMALRSAHRPTGNEMISTLQPWNTRPLLVSRAAPTRKSEYFA